MSQPPLFSLAPDTASAPAAARAPDADTQPLLAAFRDARLVQGASQQSVRRDVSQLRAVVREARAIDPSVSLRALFSDLDLVSYFAHARSNQNGRPNLALDELRRTIFAPLVA